MPPENTLFFLGFLARNFFKFIQTFAKNERLFFYVKKTVIDRQKRGFTSCKGGIKLGVLPDRFFYSWPLGGAILVVKC